MNMNTQTPMVNTHSHDAAVPVVLPNDTRRTLGHLFDTLTALGILKLDADIFNTGHRCCCEYCWHDDGYPEIVTVQTLHESGCREWFRNDDDGLAAGSECAGLQFLPFEREVLWDAISPLCSDGLFSRCDSRDSWVKFDALGRSRMAQPRSKRGPCTNGSVTFATRRTPRLGCGTYDER